VSRSCKLCDGSRHRWCEDRGGYVPCECLREKHRTERFQRAGVPTRYDAETWKTFVATYAVKDVRGLLAVAKELKAGNVEADWVLVHGRPTRARMLAAALMLRSACEGGLEARSVDVPKLIDAEFQPGRGKEFYELPVLIVELGGEPGNKWNKIVLEKCVHQRWEASLFTMFVVEGEPNRVASNYKSTRIVQAVSRRFTKVRLDPKEPQSPHASNGAGDQ